MASGNRKLTAAEKRARKRRREGFMTIFVNGKQKRVRRPPMVEGLLAYEFVRRNADDIWHHENGMWEFI